MGFEPTTCGLENRCSTVELHPQLTLLEVSPHWFDFFASTHLRFAGIGEVPPSHRGSIVVRGVSFRILCDSWILDGSFV